MNKNKVTFEEGSLLLSAMRRANRKSTFWKKIFVEHGVSDRDFIHGFPFDQLPLIDKKKIVEDQIFSPPFGSLLCVDHSAVIRVHKTSGTTGLPFLIALTENDISDSLISAKRAFLAAGIKKTDRVVHCLNFNMWSGGVSDYLGIEATGATSVPYGIGNTSELIRMVQQLQINSISCTPSYMFSLLARIREEAAFAPADLGLKKGFFGGEGLLQDKEVRNTIEKEFGMTAIDSNYGISEVLSIIAGESVMDGNVVGEGLTFHGHGIVYPELIDEKGVSVPIVEGASGEFVFSLLKRQAQPLFRYRTNDIVRIIDASYADDGLLRFRFKFVGRSDDMLVVKGVNLFPQSLASTLIEFASKLGSTAYQLFEPSDKLAKLVLKLETSLSDDADMQAIERLLLERIFQRHQVSMRIEWHPVGTLHDGLNKPKLLIREPFVGAKVVN